ncbi:putative major facilitator superfamily protein [Lyophyllum shimeji]|uniref:Major facilitator superfamily protein n=1 Tax=Lyophyllum shimeji TaxID=47721 RepID=A0A9P3PP55_LYOSH|nr:putative major facilitator superfamily protein [Lyophyllum shimeji]
MTSLRKRGATSRPTFVENFESAEALRRTRLTHRPRQRGTEILSYLRVPFAWMSRFRLNFDTETLVYEPASKACHGVAEALDAEAVVQTLASQEVTFPEGGWRAWSVVFGVWLNQFVTLGYTNAHGVYNDFYVREYLSNYPSSQISWIGSVQLFIVVSAGVVTGRAFDVGYFYHLMISGNTIRSSLPKAWDSE